MTYPSTPPVGATPDFMMPRPSTPPAASSMRASTAPDDPWRERIASLEVQISATRATATRATQELASLRERLEAASARLDATEQSVRASIERAESTVRDALARAERPLPLENLEARTSEIESVAQTARAGVAALRQELAENRRLDEARAVRLTSIEDRVTRVEDDPRPAELRLLLDRLEARLLAGERDRAQLRDRLDSIDARGATSPARTDDGAVEISQRALDRLAELERSLEEVRASSSVDVLLSRIAELESLVVESGRHTTKVAAELAELGAQRVAPVTITGAPAPAASTGSLRSIAGIGPKLESKLRALGVDDVAALAALSEDDRTRLSPELGLKPGKLDGFCAAARDLV
ncbi:MAG: hypothetical protein M3Y87_36705 [Myxococcota bacterium]|nr:hypothetical protein [Myxococcota bacterium]